MKGAAGAAVRGHFAVVIGLIGDVCVLFIVLTVFVSPPPSTLPVTKNVLLPRHFVGANNEWRKHENEWRTGYRMFDATALQDPVA